MQLFFSKMATKVDRIGSVVNRSETGEEGERDDDPEALAHHQELRILAQLDHLLPLCRLVQAESKSENWRLSKSWEGEPEQGEHVAEEVEEEKDVVGGVGAERGHAHREEGHVVEGHQADHDQFERVVIPLGCNSIADRGQDLDVALPDNGQGKGEHPLDIEGDDKEEHRENPVLHAYD